MPLINYKINLILIAGTIDGQVPRLALTDMFQINLYQLKVMQNYCNNWNQVSNSQLTGININQKQIYRHETNV